MFTCFVLELVLLPSTMPKSWCFLSCFWWPGRKEGHKHNQLFYWVYPYCLVDCNKVKMQIPDADLDPSKILKYGSNNLSFYIFVSKMFITRLMWVVRVSVKVFLINETHKQHCQHILIIALFPTAKSKDAKERKEIQKLHHFITSLETLWYEVTDQ